MEGIPAVHRYSTVPVIHQNGVDDRIEISIHLVDIAAHRQIVLRSHGEIRPVRAVKKAAQLSAAIQHCHFRQHCSQPVIHKIPGLGQGIVQACLRIEFQLLRGQYIGNSPCNRDEH
ncbi:hypothetical protein D3C75_929640 [compost metagenome]